MSVLIKITLNEGLYIKEPQDSVLGRKIIQHSILLIDEIGFEAFNFKKLAIEIKSTEASIYRYFENKHVLLVYLVSWYWEWVAYLIKINTLNIEDPKRRLEIIIHSLVSASKENPAVEYVNESTLHDVVISEGIKAHYTKGVDEENSKGFFTNYKELAALVSKVALELNPTFKYPVSFATNLLEMCNSQLHYAKHLPRLTDIKTSSNREEAVEEMLNVFANKLLVT